MGSLPSDYEDDRIVLDLRDTAGARESAGGERYLLVRAFASLTRRRAMLMDIGTSLLLLLFDMRSGYMCLSLLRGFSSHAGRKRAQECNQRGS